MEAVSHSFQHHSILPESVHSIPGLVCEQALKDKHHLIIFDTRAKEFNLDWVREPVSLESKLCLTGQHRHTLVAKHLPGAGQHLARLGRGNITSPLSIIEVRLTWSLGESDCESRTASTDASMERPDTARMREKERHGL